MSVGYNSDDEAMVKNIFLQCMYIYICTLSRHAWKPSNKQAWRAVAHIF